MKKILFLLLTTVSIYGQTLQNPTFGTVKIKNNITSATATKVNVQEADGVINTISKSDLVNVVEVNDVPSLPLVGVAGKIYVVKNLNKIYRWNGTFYQELTTDISGKEDIANKQNSLAVDGTNTKYPTVTAVNTGLALKANLASPTFTGAPLAPTATAGTNTTQIATTAFVLANGLNVPQLEYNNTDKTVWNNGKGNIATNTSFGDGALKSNTTGNFNTSSGFYSLYSNTTGNFNTASGFQSLYSNTTGGSNTASGFQSLYSNTTGGGNTASGFYSLYSNTTGGSNTASGFQSLYSNTTGGSNTASGFYSLYSNTTGNFNTASGFHSLYSNTTGNFNTASGFHSGNYIANGTTPLTASNNSTFLGASTKALADNSNNEIVIGYDATGAGSNTATLGNTSITSTTLRGAVSGGSFVKSSAPATNILLAGGGDLAQNTAFNKPFGITAGTVVEGGTLGSNAYNSTAYLPLSGGTLSGARAIELDPINGSIFTKIPSIGGFAVGNFFKNQSDDILGGFNVFGDSNSIQYYYLGLLGSEALKVTPSGNGTFAGTVTASSYTATSLPVFENNAAASSLAVGQFYRTSTGVLMVKF